MLPYARPTPLYLLPEWLAGIIGDQNRPLALPDWISAQNNTFDPRRVIRSSLLMENTEFLEGRPVTRTLFTPEQLKTMYPRFIGTQSLVNAQREAPVPGILDTTVANPTYLDYVPTIVCTPDGLDSVLKEVDTTLSQIRQDPDPKNPAKTSLAFLNYGVWILIG